MSIDTGNDINNLSPNTSYTFYCYPINQNGQYDPNIYQTAVFKTKPKIDSLTYSVVSATRIDVTIVGGAFSSVKPYYSDTGITPYTQFGSIIYGSSVTTIQYTDLTPNQRYWFSMTPYNGSNYDGTSNTDAYVDDANCVTLANITEFTNSSDPTSSEISVRWSGTYSKVNIDYYLNSTNTFLGSFPDLTSSDNPKNITGLNSNTEYKFIITPYNSANVSGTQTQLIKRTAIEKLLNYTDASFTNNTKFTQIYKFTSNKTFTINSRSSITGNVLIVGGGGGGGRNTGSDGGGGGGAGKVGYGFLTFYPDISYNIIIGVEGKFGIRGGNTTIGNASIIAEAVGGGYGARGDGTGPYTGGNGGSGGGGSGYGDGTKSGGSVVASIISCPSITFYGYSGGDAEHYKSGGGGGAGGAGNSSTTGNANGGIGFLCPIDSNYYGGGGGGGGGSGSSGFTGGSGGRGGGGTGGLSSSNKNGMDASANTGGGGGGAYSGGVDSSGGSGVVIIAFI